MVRIFGTEGSVVVPNPWVDSYCSAEAGKILLYKKPGAEHYEILTSPPVSSFACEIEAFHQAIFASEMQLGSPSNNLGRFAGKHACVGRMAGSNLGTGLRC